MKILLINKFLFPKGGSETVLFAEAGLLRSRGHSIVSLAMDHPQTTRPPWPAAFVSRVELEGPASPAAALKAAGRMLWSLESRRRLNEIIDREKPDLAHLHNIHHQISPSILPLLRRRGLPVVMTLHDLKLACPVYTCLSRGRICQRCRGGRYHWCLLRRCSKGSALKSLLAATEMTLHRRILRVERYVDLFISPSRFLADKLREMGVRIPLVHIPHFVDAASFRPEAGPPAEPSFIYFGRLDPVKGLRTLLRAASGLPWPCVIAGNGEMRSEIERAAAAAPPGRIVLRPHLGKDDLAEAVRRASFAVLPSEWYENFPMSIGEAFALGKPVVGTRIGGIPELVRDGETGLLVEPGDAAGLRRALTTLASDPARTAEMGRRARRFVEERLNPGDHYHRLMAAYERAGKGRG
jgi:glycosyltransferase involved in cell wall biosynthesis